MRMGYVWHMHGMRDVPIPYVRCSYRIRMEYEWNMDGLHSELNLQGMSKRRGNCVYGRHGGCAWNVYGKCMEYVWNGVYVRSMRYEWNVYGISMRFHDGVASGTAHP